MSSFLSSVHFETRDGKIGDVIINWINWPITHGETMLLVYLHEVGVNEALLEPDEEGERRRELKLRVLKRALDGLEDAVGGDAVVARVWLLHPGVKERAGYAQAEHCQAEPDADQHLRRDPRDCRRVKRFVVDIGFLPAVLGPADVPDVAVRDARRYQVRHSDKDRSDDAAWSTERWFGCAN